MYTLYKFNFLNGISEINLLFDDILIIWPAPVCVYIYTAFQIIMQLDLSIINIIFFYFSIKLMDGVVSQCSLDHWNQSQTPVIISLPGEPN